MLMAGWLWYSAVFFVLTFNVFFKKVRLGNFEKKAEGREFVTIRTVSEPAEEDVFQWLSLEERTRYLAFGVEKRRKQYLLGRIAAKIAIQRLVSRRFSGPSFLCNEIVVSNRGNGAPNVKKIADKDSNFFNGIKISISHSGEYGAAVAYPREVSYGIDIEVVNPSKVAALCRVLLPGEPFKRNDSPVVLTAAWCLKEALSKALLCGFGKSFENFRVSEYVIKKGEYFAKYAHFPEYEGRAIIKRKNKMALVIAECRGCGASLTAFSSIMT